MSDVEAERLLHEIATRARRVDPPSPAIDALIMEGVRRERLAPPAPLHAPQGATAPSRTRSR